LARQKRAERSGFALIFLVLFVSRQKEQSNNETLFAKTKKIKICATPANECYNRGFAHTKRHRTQILFLLSISSCPKKSHMLQVINMIKIKGTFN